MKTFADLEFKVRRDETKQAQMDLGRGLIISVIAGQSAYSKPRENGLNIEDYTSFECALLKRDVVEGYLNFATLDWIPDAGDDVLGYVSREEITSLMKRVQGVYNESDFRI
jgi:hypothetical protein